MTRSLHLPALCASVNEANLRLDCVMQDAAGCVDDPDDGVQAWTVELEGSADASALWREILRSRVSSRPEIEILRRLAPVAENGGPAYASVTLFHMLPGLLFDNAALSYMGEHGRCYCAHWGSTDIPANPDLEIVSEPFGLTVRWSPRAERWLHVADGIACHAIRTGAAMQIREEDYPIEN